MGGVRVRLVIPGRFPSLNEFYRMGPHEQSRVKRECDELVAWCARAQRLPRIKRPVSLSITWVEANDRRDLDNVAFATKFVQDGLVKAGVLENDTKRHVRALHHGFEIDRRDPRVVVEIGTEG